MPICFNTRKLPIWYLKSIKISDQLLSVHWYQKAACCFKTCKTFLSILPAIQTCLSFLASLQSGISELALLWTKFPGFRLRLYYQYMIFHTDAIIILPVYDILYPKIPQVPRFQTKIILPVYGILYPKTP